jgi:chaperonin GroEL
MAETVSMTLGPKGRNVVLAGSFGTPQIVNDGVTIAKHLCFLGTLESVGVSLLRQAASRTNDIAGDGTTTSTLLAHSIIKEGRRHILSGTPPSSLRRGINLGVMVASDHIRLQAEPLTLFLSRNNTIPGKGRKHTRKRRRDLSVLRQVATVASGNNPSMGHLISNAFDYVGRDGLVSVSEGKGRSDEIEFTDGMSFDRGFISGHFVTDKKRMETSFRGALVFLTDRKISSVSGELMPILEAAHARSRDSELRSLLIVSDTVSKGALATLVLNKRRGSFGLVAVRAPGFSKRRKYLLDDLSVLVGGQVISADSGLSFADVNVRSFGQATSVTVTQKSTSIVSAVNKKGVMRLCRWLRCNLVNTESPYERSKVEERIKNLSGGAAVLRAGGATATEQKDRRLRLEDAVHATKAAFEEGTVEGGGLCLLRASRGLIRWLEARTQASSPNCGPSLPEGELLGIRCLADAMTSPLKKIASNSGKNGEVAAARAMQALDAGELIGEGGSARERTKWGSQDPRPFFADTCPPGIVDPAKVVRVALQNAASVSSMVLTTECMVSQRTH